jgi:hypothetical protein
MIEPSEQACCCSCHGRGFGEPPCGACWDGCTTGPSERDPAVPLCMTCGERLVRTAAGDRATLLEASYGRLLHCDVCILNYAGQA